MSFLNGSINSDSASAADKGTEFLKLGQMEQQQKMDASSSAGANSEVFEQNGNEINGETFGLVYYFREKMAKLEMELKQSTQLCIIKELEKKTLQSELEKQKLMTEHVLLQAKVAKMEEEKEDQQKKMKENVMMREEMEKCERGKFASADQFTQLQNDQKVLLERVGELEKQNKKLTDQAFSDQFQLVLAKISEFEKQQQQMVAKMEQEQQQKETEKYAFANEQKVLLERIGELEKQLLKPQQEEEAKRAKEITELEKQQKVISQQNCWDAIACHIDCQISGQKDATVQIKGNCWGWRSVFAKFGTTTTSSCSSDSAAGVFYFEMEIVNLGSFAIIGFATKAMPLDGRVGRHPNSYGYASDGSFLINGSKIGENLIPQFVAGDVVGCGINLTTQKIIFTKNGQRIDNTSNLFALTFSSVDGPMFPCVSLCNFSDLIVANFGPDFKFNLASL